ncbi:photosystem II complex extrinsic protein PsbU [Trichothermofontia sp.]
MKSLIRCFAICCIAIMAIVDLWGSWVSPAMAASESDVSVCQIGDQKIDLNNANLSAFIDCPGFYPNLAKIIVNNGPFNQVEDVLKIADLSSDQKALLKANLKNFTISDPTVPIEMRMPPRLPGISH